MAEHHITANVRRRLGEIYRTQPPEVDEILEIVDKELRKASIRQAARLRNILTDLAEAPRCYHCMITEVEHDGDQCEKCRTSR